MNSIRSNYTQFAVKFIYFLENIKFPVFSSLFLSIFSSFDFPSILFLSAAHFSFKHI